MSESSDDDVADAAIVPINPTVADAASVRTSPGIANAVNHSSALEGYDDADATSDASSVGYGHGHRIRKNRRRRTNWMVLTLMTVLCLAYLIFVLVIPQLELSLFRMRNPQKKLLPPELDVTWVSLILLRTSEFLFVGWFFYFGASIGSFLNVVAWRVPEGRTIVFGGSKCPFCDTNLRFIDNTPILGWLVLQGRCRTCRLPIAPRYLMIEIAMGATFMWLALWQLVRGSINLPHWNFPSRAGIVNIVLDPQWPSIGIYVIHAFMFGFLIMLATANTGKKPFPILSLCVIGFCLGSFKIIAPFLDLVPWHNPMVAPEFNGLGRFANPALSVLIGGIVGGAIGWMSSFVFARRFGEIVGRHWTLQCFLLGTVLGWQSVVTILVASLVVYPIVRPANRIFQAWTASWSLANKAIGLNACFILIALVHHSLWFQIAHLLRLA